MGGRRDGLLAAGALVLCQVVGVPQLSFAGVPATARSAVSLASVQAAAHAGAGADQSWRPTYPDTPYPDIKASSDPKVIAAGDYLFWAVANCPSCHIPHGKFAYVSPQEIRKLSPTGGEEWSLGPIGVIRSANITPDRDAGIGAWTDREVARAIKYAISRDGRPIFFMNGMGYIDDRDLRAIVSYLKTLAPVARKSTPTQISVAGQQIMRTQMQGWLQPKPQRPVPYMAPGDISIARGAYLANGPARCIHCHSDLADSPRVALKGAPFAGSLWPDEDRDDPKMEINAPNLTPSKRYGVLANWDEAAFIARIRAGRAIKNSIMPWEDFRLMTDVDLASIYRYLKSLTPVDRAVGPTYRPKGWKPETHD
jgi:mono/diheme cytochrome c family protein